MKLENAKITLLVNYDHTTIEILDSKSAKPFVKITLTNDQLASALSRTGRTDCSVEVFNLETLGKTMELQSFSFAINDTPRSDKEKLHNLCLAALKESNLEDWTPDKAYSSQDTFFTSKNINHARTTIRRWV